MPLYDFKCSKCQKVFEESVKLAELETKVVNCPDCHEPAQLKLTGIRTTSSTWKYWRLGD